MDLEEQIVDRVPSSSAAATVVSRSSTNEKDVTLPVRGGGYLELAEFMAAYPAGAIFRRFKSLHILKLLYLQSDLIALEIELKYYAKIDSESSDRERRKYYRDYQKLKYGETESDAEDKNNRQHKAWIKLSEKLKEYDEALHETTALLNMPDSDKNDLIFLKGWMQHKGDIELSGIDYDVWEKTDRDDLLALAGSNHNDFISQWVDEKFLPRFHRVCGRWIKKKVPAGSPLAGTTFYDAPNVGFVLSILTISVASALPILATVVLDSITSHKLKIGLMALFTIIFSFFLGLTSGAKKSEVFAASAAFAAVLVVFISGNGCCSNP